MTDERFAMYEKVAAILPSAYNLFDVHVRKDYVLCFIDSRNGRDTIKLPTDQGDLRVQLLRILNEMYPGAKVTNKKSSGNMGPTNLSLPSGPLKPSIKPPMPAALPALPMPKAVKAPKMPTVMPKQKPIAQAKLMLPRKMK